MFILFLSVSRYTVKNKLMFKTSEGDEVQKMKESFDHHNHLPVSKIGIGCWAFGGGEYWGEQNQQDVDAVVRSAIDAGITLFDTARMYNDGASEQSLGKALRGIRDKAIICSKVSPAKAYYKSLIEECDRSLKSLGTDYIDVYMLHWPLCPKSLQHFTDDPAVIANPPTSEEAFSALLQLKKEGKIRKIGVSNYGVTQLKDALAICPEIEVNELSYNILSRAIEAELVPLCHEKDIQIISSMTLQQGILAGIYRSAEEVPPHQAHSRHFADIRGKGTSRHGEPGVEKEMFYVVDLLHKLAEKLNITVAQLSIAWVLHKKFISSALIGCRNTEELSCNLEALKICLPEDVVKQIDDASLPIWNKLGNSPDYYENLNESRIF